MYAYRTTTMSTGALSGQNRCWFPNGGVASGWATLNSGFWQAEASAYGVPHDTPRQSGLLDSQPFHPPISARAIKIPFTHGDPSRITTWCRNHDADTALCTHGWHRADGG
jgi:hypothetical protein